MLNKQFKYPSTEQAGPWPGLLETETEIVPVLAGALAWALAATGVAFGFWFFGASSSELESESESELSAFLGGALTTLVWGLTPFYEKTHNEETQQELPGIQEHLTLKVS